MATTPLSAATSPAAIDAAEALARVHVVCAEPSIANHFLAELRDKEVQKDSLRFRRNLQRLGESEVPYESEVVDDQPSAASHVAGDPDILAERILELATHQQEY